MTASEWLKDLLQKAKKNPALELPDEADDEVDPVPGKPVSKAVHELSPDEIAAIHLRIQAWRRLYPQGEPQYSRRPPWRVFIYAQDVAHYYKRTKRTAQRIMRNTRFYHSKEKNARITVSEFCIANDENEQLVREFLFRLDEQYGTPFNDE